MAGGSSDNATDDGALQRVLAAGVDWVGREFTRRLRDSLNAMGEAPDVASRRAAGRTNDDDWVTGIVFAGDELPGEVYFDVILAAVDEADGDESVLRCIADGPVDHLVGRDLDLWGPRFHAERGTATIDLMFRAMQLSLRADGHRLGWWDDDACKDASPRRRSR